MNEYQKHFASLQQYFTEQIYDKYDSRISEIEKEQNKTKETIVNELGKILLFYTIKDGLLSLKNIDRMSLINKFEKLINKLFTYESNFETELCKEIYEGVAKDKFFTNEYIYSQGKFKTNYHLKHLSDEKIKKIINKKIDGKNFSDRIWNNKNEVAKQLKVEINKFLDGKTDVNSISKVIQKKFGANKFNSDRLVKDSIGKVQESIDSVWREEHNIKYVIWDATLDFKVCEDCAPRDGKIYEVNKVPEKHVLCRCSINSIIDKNWRPKERWDNNLHKRINWKTYEEWMEENNIT